MPGEKEDLLGWNAVVGERIPILMHLLRLVKPNVFLWYVLWMGMPKVWVSLWVCLQIVRLSLILKKNLVLKMWHPTGM